MSLEHHKVPKLRYKSLQWNDIKYISIRQSSRTFIQQELLASMRSLRITSIALPANCKLDALPWKNATFPTVLNSLKQIGKQHCCVTSLLYYCVIGPHYRNNTLYYKYWVTIINLWLHTLSTKAMNSRLTSRIKWVW